jgi:hypothetical protein
VVFRRKQSEPSSPLFDPAKVDLVTLSPDETTVELVIVADSGWSGSDEQIRSLQEKIQTYVGFAVDGHLAASYPDVADRPWTIVLRCGGDPPDARTAEVLERTAGPVRSYGGDLQVRTS